MEILADAGYWTRREGPVRLIMLLNVPRGPNGDQTDMFLRERGRVVFSDAGPDAAIRAKKDFVVKYGLVLNEDVGFDRSPVIDTAPAGAFAR